MAAIIPIIATTMRSSISEKPSWRLFVFISLFVLLREKVFRCFSRQRFRRYEVTAQSAKCSGRVVTRTVPVEGLGKWAVNSGVFFEINFVVERAFGPGDKLKQKGADGFR